MSAESSIIDGDIIPTNTSQYSAAQKLEACALYAILGNFTKVSKQLSIPDNTLHSWKNESWWERHIVAIREETKAKTLAGIDKIIEKGLRATEERLDVGDAIVHQGEITGYKPITAKDSATVAAIMIDKRQILLNQPTSIRGESAGMTDLVKRFEELAAQSQERIVSDQ